jgi:hypothetical protein
MAVTSEYAFNIRLTSYVCAVFIGLARAVIYVFSSRAFLIAELK